MIGMESGSGSTVEQKYLHKMDAHFCFWLWIGYLEHQLHLVLQWSGTFFLVLGQVPNYPVLCFACWRSTIPHGGVCARKLNDVFLRNKVPPLYFRRNKAQTKWWLSVLRLLIGCNNQCVWCFVGACILVTLVCWEEFQTCIVFLFCCSSILGCPGPCVCPMPHNMSTIPPSVLLSNSR
jgi:hypothetical protein